MWRRANRPEIRSLSITHSLPLFLLRLLERQGLLLLAVGLRGGGERRRSASLESPQIASCLDFVSREILLANAYADYFYGFCYCCLYCTAARAQTSSPSSGMVLILAQALAPPQPLPILLTLYLPQPRPLWRARANLPDLAQRIIT